MAFIKHSAPAGPAGATRAAPRDRAGLIAELGAADAAQRRWAARDLAQHGQASAALAARLQVEPDAAVREVILTSLARIGDADAVAGLAACLRSEDAALRNEAIEAMKSLPDAVAPVMGGLLADPDPDVRILAVNVLESLRHAQVEAWLIGVIARDPEVNVCGAALDLLAEVGSMAAHDALLDLKRRFGAEPYIQFAADLALRNILVKA